MGTDLGGTMEITKIVEYANKESTARDAYEYLRKTLLSLGFEDDKDLLLDTVKDGNYFGFTKWETGPKIVAEVHLFFGENSKDFHVVLDDGVQIGQTFESYGQIWEIKDFWDNHVRICCTSPLGFGRERIIDRETAERYIALLLTQSTPSDLWIRRG